MVIGKGKIRDSIFLRDDWTSNKTGDPLILRMAETTRENDKFWGISKR